MRTFVDLFVTFGLAAAVLAVLWASGILPWLF